MATNNVDGTPNIALRVNQSGGTTGTCQVQDYNGGSPTVLLSIDSVGKVRPPAPWTVITTTGGTAGMLHLGQTVLGSDQTRLEFNFDGSNNRVRVKATTTGHAVAVESPDASGIMLELRNSGGSRMTFDWDNTNAMVKLDAVGASDKIRLTADQVLINTDNTTGVISAGDHRHYFWVYDKGSSANPRYELRVIRAVDPDTGNPSGYTVIASWN